MRKVTFSALPLSYSPHVEGTGWNRTNDLSRRMRSIPPRRNAQLNFHFLVFNDLVNSVLQVAVTGFEPAIFGL